MSESFCFGTLAVGPRYRAHAQLLAADIQEYAPNKTLVILTDKLDEFKQFSHVLAYKHHIESVKGYYDKSFVIENALANFETCLFLDSDLRILGPVPEYMDFAPGLTGRFGCPILKHNKNLRKGPGLPLIETVGKGFKLDFDKVSWLHECFFAVRRQEGLEKRFFHYWKLLGYYFQTKGVYSGVGNIMGLAAAIAEFSVEFKRDDFFPFFKDCIEKFNIKEGKSTWENKAAYFKAHQDIEYPSRGLVGKITHKISSQIGCYSRLAQIYWSASQDEDFKKLKTILRNYESG